MYLLKPFGGIWADATTFCLKPLSEGWLTEAIQKYKFYTFRHATAYQRPIEVWFIATLSGHPIIESTFDRFFKYIFKPRRVSLVFSSKRKMMKKIGVNKKDKNKLFMMTYSVLKNLVLCHIILLATALMKELKDFILNMNKLIFTVCLIDIQPFSVVLQRFHAQ